MRWSDIEREQPRLAEAGTRLLIGPGVVLVATIRRDGTPRLSPVEPLILDGSLWLSMMWRSTKAADLFRDPRVLVHSVIADRDGSAGEFKVRGAARAEDDRAVQRRYAETAARELGWEPEFGQSHLFEVDISDIALVSYDVATGDQHVAIWPPPREFIRRATSATSVGKSEPVTDLIRSGLISGWKPL
jgi:pyridoxamine 5'-phosphate oxidase-like protein